MRTPATSAIRATRNLPVRAIGHRWAGLVFLAAVLTNPCPAGEGQLLRPPAVPLVTHDPYFSIWSFGDQLAGSWPKHWTGTTHGLTSMIRVDGRPFRLMGTEPGDVPPARQESLRVLPTRTLYHFEAGGVGVALTFTSPLLPESLDLLGRPASYLTWDVRPIDGREHQVSIYFDNTAEPAVNDAGQSVTWTRPVVAGLEVMSFGTTGQPVLEKRGDDLRIDWGYLFTAARAAESPRTWIAPAAQARAAFADGRPFGDRDDSAQAPCRQGPVAGRRRPVRPGPGETR